MKFRGLSLCVVATGMALSLAGPASAAFITGSISITGADNINYTNQTIGLLPGTAKVGAATFDFAAAGFNFGDSAIMRNEGVLQAYGPVPVGTFWDSNSNLS